MNILDKIKNTKLEEVRDASQLQTVKSLEQSMYFQTKAVSLKKYLSSEEKSGIIAEIKKQSPSLGIINAYVDVEKTSIGYMQAGASALSILTDKTYFGGSVEDLKIARKYNYCPILRKDFIVHEFQILESKAIGADAILLIAAMLSTGQIIQFTDLAHALGMEVCMEIHSEDELSKCYHKIDVLGVNNRNLKDMSIDINNSIRLAKLLPDDKIKISESGIENPEVIAELREYGYTGFLIGSFFMKQSLPHMACRNFISTLKSKKSDRRLNNNSDLPIARKDSVNIS